MALAAGLAGGWGMRGVAVPQNGVAALAREAAENYRVYANDAERPVEIAAADEPKLVEWVSDRLQRRVVPPNLTAAGFRLLGAWSPRPTVRRRCSSTRARRASGWR